MEDEEISPVIQLLLDRRETHPEEFGYDLHERSGQMMFKGRWDDIIRALGWYMTEKERLAIYGSVREKMIQAMYDKVAHRLLAGER